jgi:hypothetical protein
VPFYGLDLVQKRALAAALKRLPGRAPLEPARERDWRLKQLNCYACHELAGTGGPETSREVYFGFRDAAAVAMGRDGHLPPALDGVGPRLAKERILPFLTGADRPPSPRPRLLVPMPRFRADVAAPFAGLLPVATEP